MENKKLGRTLFVGNLPYSVDNNKIEELFSDIGPLKRSFIVKDKGTDKSKGIGYVTFSLREDAEKASKQLIRCDGRKLLVKFADAKASGKGGAKKRVKHESKDPTSDDEDGANLISVNDEAEEEKKKKIEAEPALTAKTGSPDAQKESVAKKKRQRACVVVLSGLSENVTKDDIAEFSKDIKNVCGIEYPVAEREERTAFVRCQSKKDAVKATKRFIHGKIKGSHLQAVLLSQETLQRTLNQKAAIPNKKCKLIIRNLSFKCKQEDLENVFKKFGEITEVKIPTKPDGKMFGFGFVQFSTLQSASNALKDMNAKQILGRPVAVDWALARDKYQEAKKAVEKQTPEPASGDDKNISKSEESENESESESLDQDMSSDRETDSEDEEESERSDQDETDESDASESEDEEEERTGKSKKMRKQSNKNQKDDVEEGRTLFIRNISFDSEPDNLKELFSEYGELNYCRIVLDPETERPRGTAFLQFKTKEDADKCLEESSEDAEDGGLVLDGRKLLVTLAVSRKKAQELRDSGKTKENKDKRNLWLAREGMIRTGTQSAAGVSSADMDKRMKVEKMKRQKLKNPNIFISTTRLCFHNLPTAVDDQQLRQLLLKNLSDKSAKITECRIMRDMERVNSKGVAKSRGYAFVNFSKHEHALKILRETNNNPEIFGENKRPIVEFSLENKAALLAKEKRLERWQAKMDAKDKTNTADGKRNKRVKSSKHEGRMTAILAPVPTSEDQKQRPKGMPSHWGPKVRHKPRPSQQAHNKSKKAKLVQQPAKRKALTLEKAPKQKRQRKEKADNFENLVAKYKKVLGGNKNRSGSKSANASKWFE